MMRRAWSSKCVGSVRASGAMALFVLAFLLGGAESAAAAAQDLVSPDSAGRSGVAAGAEAADGRVLVSRWRLRRVLVPESELAEVIEGSYLPIPRERFESLVEAEREASRPPLAERALGEIILTGRLDADGCLQGVGTAWLEEGTRGWVESLAPSFWLGRARWRELERTREPLSSLPSVTASDGNRGASGIEVGVSPMSRASGGSSSLPADVGRFGAIQGLGPSGRWTVEGIGAAELAFDWMALPEASWKGESPATGFGPGDSPSTAVGPEGEFLLSVPQAVRLVVQLDLPESLRVETSDGLVRLEHGAPLPSALGLRRWRLDLTPGGAARVRLVSASAPRVNPVTQPLRYETETVGQVGVGSIELRTTVRVGAGESGDLIWSCPEGWNPIWDDSTTAVLRPEAIPFDSGAGPISATRWRWRGFSTSGGLAPSDRSYTIAMRREFDPDARVSLATPRIEGLWQRGSWELSIDPRITLQEVELRAGEWTASVSGWEGINGVDRRLRWRETSEDSSISFVVGLEREGFRGVALTEILAEGGKVSASCRAWLRAVGEPSFIWHGQIADGWVVDRIIASETGVPDVSMIEGWDLVPSDSGAIRLEVRFAQPLRPDREVMLTVEAHRLSFPSPVDALSSEELRLISWESTAQVRHWLGLRAESPYRLEGGRAIPPPTVTSEFDERVVAWRTSNPSSALLLLDGRSPAQYALRTESDESLEVEVEIDATLFERSARQEIVMRCRPVGGRPTNLRLAWDRPSQGDWQWRLYLPARGLSYPVQALEEGTSSGESLLSWGMGIDEAFELVGIGTESWESDWRPRLPVRFRNGILTVSSRARSVLRCTVEGDARLPASVASLPEDSQLLSIVDLSMLGTPLTVVRTEVVSTIATQDRLAAGHIEQAVLESWPGAQETRHRLRLRFSDLSPTAVKLTPPAGARWTATRVGERRFRPEPGAEAANGEAEISPAPAPGGRIETVAEGLQGGRPSTGASPVWVLPMLERRAGEEMEIEFLTSSALPSLRGTLPSAFPELDVPVLSRRWRLHLPVGYELMETTGRTPRDLWSWMFERWTGVAWRGLTIETSGERTEHSLAIEFQDSLSEALVVEISSPDFVSGQVVLIRRPAWDWISLSLILGLAFVGAAIMRRRSLVLLPIAGLIAIWLPESWADLSWVFLPAGALAVLLTRVETGLPPRVGEREPRATMASQRAMLASVLIVLIAARTSSSVAVVTAQEPANGTEISSARPVERERGEGVERNPRVRTATLYVPVDRDGNERTDLIYVPRDLYDALVREAPRGESDPAWLIEATRHTIEAESNPFGDRPRMRVTSRYRLRTLERGLSWAVPTWGDRLAIQPGQVLLDSMPARLSGTATGELRVSIDSPGVHEVLVTATGLVGEEGIAWEGTAPAVIDSEIRLASLSGQGLSLVSPEFWLETDRLGGGRRWRAGPTGTVRLASRERTEATSSKTTLAMLEYLEPSEDGARMTLWLTAGPQGKLPERLSLRVSGEWEVATEALPAGVELRVTRGVAETSCVLIPGGGDQPPDSVAIRLISNRAIQMGRQPLPRVRVDDHPLGARFLAWRQPNQSLWSIENELGLVLTGIDSAASWWSGNQLASMGVPERDRRLAVRPLSSSEWLRVVPVEPILDVDHQWQVRVASTGIRWEASSVVSVMRGEVSALELAATLPLDVESVSLAGPDRSDPVEFLRLAPNRVLLRLPSTQRTTFHLILRGTFRGAPLVSQPLPLLDFPRIASITHRATFERAPEVSVLVDSAADTTAGSVSDMGERENFLASWRTQRRGELLGERDDARRWSGWLWQWQPSNAPLIDRALTRFVREGTAWRVTLDLHVADDEPWGADRLDLEVPAGFIGLDGQIAGRWESSSPRVPVGLARFVPEQRISAGSWVRLEGRLSRFPDGKTAPRVISSMPIRRLIAVPPAGKDDAFLWKYERYRPIDDGEAMARLPTERNWLLLEAEDLEASIRLASKPQIARPARVFLAEHRIETQEDHWLIDSRMLVDPGGRRQVSLRLPEPSEVIVITIDGEIRRLGSAGTFELTSRELPQVVRVVVRTTEAACFAERTGVVDDVNRVSVPRLDLEVLNEVIAMRRDALHGSIVAEGSARVRAEPLNSLEWGALVESARESAANSSATIAGLSPVAVRRWRAAFRGQEDEAMPGEASSEGPSTVDPADAVDARDRIEGDQEKGGEAVLDSTQSEPMASLERSREGRDHWDLPVELEHWQAFRWRGAASRLVPGVLDPMQLGRAWGSVILLLMAGFVGLFGRRGGARFHRLIAVLIVSLGAVTLVSSESIWPGIGLILMGIPLLLGRNAVTGREGLVSVVLTTAALHPRTESGGE